MDTQGITNKTHAETTEGKRRKRITRPSTNNTAFDAAADAGQGTTNGAASGAAGDAGQGAMNGTASGAADTASDAEQGTTNGADQTGAFGTTEQDAAAVNQGRESSVREVIAEFNDKYAVVSDEGDTVIYHRRSNPQRWQSAYVPMNFEDLRKLYQNRKINVGTDKKPNWRSVAEVWLDHPDRTTYSGGLVYAPPRLVAPPDALNLWRGFAVEPAPGSWGRLHSHIFENICKADDDNFNYFIDKLAYAVQNPGLPGEVATVMYGGSGTGKGIVGREMAHLYGPHALQISNRRHLVGNFNEHLVGRSLVFSDEAFYPGDKPSISVLKSLLTEELFVFEGKFKTAKQMPNAITLIMASNEEWVVPAEMDARRFFVLEVSGKQANNHAYFEAIDAEMSNGGRSAMLHDLLHRDLAKFNVRAVPQTAGLLVQKLHSLELHVGWWHECLTQGYVYRSKHGQEAHFEQWHPFVAMDLLYASYTEYCRGKKGRHLLARELLGRFLQKFGTQARPVTGVIGEIAYSWAPESGRLKGKDRPHGYDFADLATVRARFTAVTKLPIAPGPP